MVNGLHLYSAFIQSAVQFMPSPSAVMPLIHPFTHTFTHQRRLAAMQGTNQLVRSNRGLGVLLRDTSTRPGWDRTGNPPTARRQLLPPASSPRSSASAFFLGPSGAFIAKSSDNPCSLCAKASRGLSPSNSPPFPSSSGGAGESS